MNVRPSLSQALVLASTLAILTATGCHKKAEAPPAPIAPAAAPAAAPTAAITADPLAVDLGQSVVLNWRTQNATSVTIDGIGEVAANGTQTVSPSSSTNFHLTAKGDGGTTEANVRVTVRVPVAPTAPVDTGDAGTEAAFRQNVQDIFFDFDSYDLRPDAQSSLPTAAAYIKAHPGLRVIIGGFADERGSAEYNLAFGENRANAARTALISRGVAPGPLRVISFGQER